MKVTLARSIELLTELAELQNGPPLFTYEKQWNETMENVWEFIHNYEKRFENVPNPHNIWDDQNEASYGALNRENTYNSRIT